MLWYSSFSCIFPLVQVFDEDIPMRCPLCRGSMTDNKKICVKIVHLHSKVCSFYWRHHELRNAMAICATILYVQLFSHSYELGETTEPVTYDALIRPR